MSLDLTITRDGELMVAHIEAVSNDAEDFIDAYMPASGEYVVVDSGRIIVPEGGLEAFYAAARHLGLVWEVFST